MSSTFGRFVWYDYMANDVGAALDFYTGLIGWGAAPFGEGGDYLVLSVGDRGTGGVMALSADARAMGAPPHWLGFVAVPDCDATAARVTALGGQVFAPPFDVPTVGRCAIFADPFGAVIGVIQPASEMSVPFELGDRPPQGAMVWHELYTKDVAAALAFYGDVFGWIASDTMDMGEMGVYQLFKLAGMDLAMGGIMAMQPGMSTSAFTYYVGVDDLDAAIARATSAGAQVINGPMDVPNQMRIINALDPQGGVFSLLGP